MGDFLKTKTFKKIGLSLFLLIFSALVWKRLSPWASPQSTSVGTFSSDVELTINGQKISPTTQHPQEQEIVKVLPVQELPPDLKQKANAISKNFNYDHELQKIELLKQQLPQSKQDLVKIVTSLNPYDKEKIPIQLQSSEEITYRQIESLKTLALKALVEHEKSKTSLIGDLNHIIKSAHGDKIKFLAQEARESAQKGQSYFKSKSAAQKNKTQSL